MLPVEQFMRDYFRHTDRVSATWPSGFVAKARPAAHRRALDTALFGHRIDRGIRAGPTGMMAARRGLEAAARQTWRRSCELVDLANLYDKPIAPATWEAVRQRGRPPAARPTRPPEAGRTSSRS